MEKKAKTNLTAIIFLLVLIFLLLIVNFVFLFSYQQNEKKTEQNLTSLNEEELIQFVPVKHTDTEPDCTTVPCTLQTLEAYKSGTRGGGGGEDIECHSNRDCGTSTFIGAPFCTENNVTRKYISYTCHNPGKKSSYCSSLITNYFVEQCTSPNICFQGSCLRISCSTDLECADSNPLTLDKCENPGTPQARCSNIPIQCNQNSDCGNETFVGSAFCIQNKVYQNLSSPRCQNPGTASSSCYFVFTPVLKLTCEYACNLGECVRCNTNSDCNDGNPQTQDICLNPGTPQSRCQNNPQCQNQCALGSRRCSGNGYQLCGDFNNDGCYEWGNVQNCQPNEICEAGFCIPQQTCTNECSFVGQTICTGSTHFKICGYFDNDPCLDWSQDPTYCGYGFSCQNGMCV